MTIKKPGMFDKLIAIVIFTMVCHQATAATAVATVLANVAQPIKIKTQSWIVFGSIISASSPTRTPLGVDTSAITIFGQKRLAALIL